MAFTTIPTSIVAAGKAVTAYLMGLIKDDLDDLDQRTTLLETSASKIIIFNELVYIPTEGSTLTNIARYRAASNYNITDCKVAIGLVGSLTGTLEVDIKTASTPDPTSATTIFTTKPSVSYATASDYDVSSNVVLDATAKVITSGEYIFLSFSALPGNGPAGAVQVYLTGEPS